ncbi:NADH dehydrogenase [ubiquinone] 1 alpha subcomplex assembly factor 3, partial [Eufriesea mexicana]
VGFQLSDKSIVVGPIAIFSQTIFSWDIVNAKDINEATLSLFTVLDPSLDVLILGLETQHKYEDIQKIKKILHKYRIRNEIIPVQQACGIYNHLICERRYVAAGLIPPLICQSDIRKVPITENVNKADQNK